MAEGFFTSGNGVSRSELASMGRLIWSVVVPLPDAFAGLRSPTVAVRLGELGFLGRDKCVLVLPCG